MYSYLTTYSVSMEDASLFICIFSFEFSSCLIVWIFSIFLFLVKYFLYIVFPLIFSPGYQLTCWLITSQLTKVVGRASLPALMHEPQLRLSLKENSGTCTVLPAWPKEIRKLGFTGNSRNSVWVIPPSIVEHDSQS